MKTDINIHMFPARHMVRAVRLAVLSLLFWIGLMPASAQIYSTAQGGTQYKGTYEEAYGSMNNGYYGSMEAQYEYNPYQSNVYTPGSSTPNTGLRKHHLSVYNPWSESYAPMRTKKNSPTGEPGGAIGEDNKSENDPEGETGAPDGFITPSDPGHQSNQSPVGEAWVLLFFAAAAALAVFIRQKREKRHIAIYSETQQPSDKSNMKQHIRKSLFISIILLAGVSNAWGVNITGGTTLYLKPNSNWTKDGARFAAYLCNGSSSAEWYSMSDCNGDGIYEMTVNDGNNHKNIIFCRMNPNNGTNDWAQKWNQTGDLTWDGTNNLYTMTTGSWDAGSWSKKSVTWDLAGDMNDWNNTANQLSGSPLSVSVILEENTTYEFKLHNSEGCWWGNTGTMERNNCSGWTMTHGLGNCKITTDISGTYKFSFDASTKKLTVTYPEECYLKGEFNYWANTSSLMNGSTTINLAANTTYKFKIHNYGATSESWHGNTGTMTRDNCFGWVMDNAADCQITTDFAGEYEFTYDRTTQTLSVTYPAAYTITYGVGTNKGTNSVTTNPHITSGDLALANTPITFSKGETIEGYVWKGWYSKVDGTGTKWGDGTTYTSSNRTGDISVYACYDFKNYNITYILNGGSGTMNPTTYTLNTSTFNLPTPTKEHYNFAGWFDNANLTGNEIKQITKGSTGDKIFYAKWTPKEYSITYNELHGVAHTNPTKYTIESETITFSTPTSERTGYSFSHWTPASLAKGSTGNQTVTANWTANTYTVTFDQQSGTGGTSSVTATYNAAMPSITIPTRTGYTFGGYYTAINGGGTQYYNANGTSAKNWAIANNTTLYAKWTETKHSITVNANPQSYGKVSTNSVSVGQFTSSANITATANEGYEFVNWIATDGITINNPNNATTTITATKAGTLTANFQALPGKTVYLKPVDYWLDANARFAVYAWNNSGNEWIEMEDVGCNREYFVANIPAQFKSFKFVRINPAATELSFANEVAWNQTPNLSIPTDGKNLLIYPRIYLKPNSNWTADNARSSAYFFEDGKEARWMSMYKDGDYYYCQVPGEDHANVIFARMNPNTSDNNFNDGVRWNQTANLHIEGNCYTLSGELNNLSGSWSTLWTTYSASKYSVTLNATKNGTTTATYNSTTTTSKNNGTATLTNIPLNQNVTFTFTPAEGYQFANAKITIGNQELEVYTSTFTYPICGPATVSAHFVATETRKIYLRPNDDWMKDSPVFATYAFKEGSDVHQWYIMNTEDTDYTGAYSCDISTTYDHVHFVRINPKGSNPHNQGINWANAWNQTIALEIVNDIYNTQNKKRFEIIAKNTDPNKGDLNHYDGAWEENTPIWGITSDFDNWHAEDAVFMGYPGKLNILLSAASHEFKLYNFRHGDYYGNTGTYQRTNSGQWWTMDLHNNEGNNCTVVADIDNEAYLFQLQLITETGTYKKQISITYPDFTGGAYRLAYKDNTPGSFHPAHYIKYNASEEVHLDTISFFIHHDKEPEIWLQQCTDDIYTQNPTWKTIAIYPATSSFPTSDNPGNAMLPGKRNSDATLHIGNGCGITESGVYNFILQQTNNPDHNAVLNATDTHPYKGDYYIRTDSAEGGWTNYQEASNLMTYSSYADHNEPFSYYFCKWIHSDTKTANKGNVTYTVANDYSRCISDTLIGDNIIAKDGVTAGCLPDSANVRFTWDHETNALARAYIRGSGQSSDRFLVLTGKDENLKDADGEVIPEGTGDLKGILANEKLLTDMGNWIYQVDVTANRATLIKLTAKYNDKTQYFKGSEGDNDDNYASLLSSTAHDSYKIRIIYDFKTNHLITAWLPNEQEDIPDDEELGADMMIIRTNQEATQQINFTNNATLSDVGIGYAVMTFTKAHVNGSSSQYNRALYWVSFPFDVWLQDVFGFGEYGQHWIMEYYDGVSRAANGLWADSDTYWKYITNPNYKLEAGKGYVLCLNLGKMTASSAVFENTDEVSLYFPSASPLQTITSEVTAAEVPAHTCTIERDNRNIYDSNWNLIGVPGFKDIHIEGIDGSAHLQYNDEIDADCVSFYYAYQPDDNTYTAGDASRTNNFQIMYSYMVQFAGTIEWSSPAFKAPSSVAARRTGDMPSEHTLRLELAQGEDKADQTIIKLQEQDATADFDMNIDMTKIKNSGANIYTLTENTAIMVAGNALPMEKTTIPVGIEVANAGTYTLRMPDGTDGISVTLIDNQTGIHTDMLLSEYTITLDAGSHLNRFYIAVDPDRTATSVENVGEEAKGDKAKGVEKFLIDGQLFIRTAEGIFDAQGRKL